MIYFDATTQRQVLERIHRVMKPGGMLFVGHAENFSDARSLFALRGKTVYESAFESHHCRVLRAFAAQPPDFRPFRQLGPAARPWASRHTRGRSALEML